MVNGHKAFKAPITFLIPPAYEGAHSLWDDPMLLHGTFTTPFSSGYFFMKYVAKVFINVLIALQCLWQLNLFFLLLLLLQFWKKKRAVLLQKGFWRTDGVFFCGLLIALYVSVHIETRYLLIVLIAAPLIWRQCFTETVFTRIYPWLIGATLLFPVIDTAERWHKNEELFRQAAFLRSKHIEGNITSNAYKSGPSWVLAYLTDSRYYTLENFDVSIEEYLAELKRYHIDYFIEYKEAPHWQLISPDMTTFQELYSTKDFTVYRIR
jgi:hypothetical protein